MTETEKLIYLAGALDYSGAVYMHKKPNGTDRPKVMMVSKDRDALQALADAFGGNVTHGKSLRGAYRWQRTHVGAKEMLLALRPFLVRRAAIADKIIAWEPGHPGAVKQERKPRERKPKPAEPLPAWNGLLQVAGRGKPLPQIRDARRVEFP